LFILKAVLPKLGYINVPVGMSWIAAGILWIGSVIAAFAMVGLGRSLKVVYHVCKQHCKHGVFTGSAGTHCIPDIHDSDRFLSLFSRSDQRFICHLRNLYPSPYCQGEERFLSGRFGSDWEKYSASVRRYL